MKLKDCTIGKLVQIEEEHKIGHVVGLTYNVSLSVLIQYNYSHEELKHRVIPLVQFVDSDIPRGVHHENLSPVNW